MVDLYIYFNFKQNRNKLNYSFKFEKINLKTNKEKQIKTKQLNSLNNTPFQVNKFISIFLLLSMLLLTKAETLSDSHSSSIILRFIEIGFFQYLGTDFNIIPTHLYVGDIEQDDDIKNSKMVNITNITETVKLVWINTIIDNCANLFYNLPFISVIDMSGFDSSLVTDTSNMFANCLYLLSLNLTDFNTSSVTNMNAMFSGSQNLKFLDVSSFDTSKVNTMVSLFSFCVALTTLNVSNFNTAQFIIWKECSNIFLI